MERLPCCTEPVCECPGAFTPREAASADVAELDTVVGAAGPEGSTFVVGVVDAVDKTVARFWLIEINCSRLLI